MGYKAETMSTTLTLALSLFGLAALIIIGVVIWIINAKV